MWIVELALRRPLSVAVMALLMLVLGALSFAMMNVDIFPAINLPVVMLVYNYPGLSAIDMERRIVLITERAYSTTVNGIEHIESESTPEPIQQPHPPIWLGGFTPAALRRAARYGDGFTVPGATRDVYNQYVAELKKQNRPTETIRFASAVWCLLVSNDPEKTFAEAADHIIYQANNYSAWLSAAGLSPLSDLLRDREQLRQSGLLQVVDPNRAVSMIRDFTNNVPVTHYYSWTLPPGLPPRWAQSHLELFASKVIPAFC